MFGRTEHVSMYYIIKREKEMNVKIVVHNQISMEFFIQANIPNFQPVSSRVSS